MRAEPKQVLRGDAVAELEALRTWHGQQTWHIDSLAVYLCERIAALRAEPKQRERDEVRATIHRYRADWETMAEDNDYLRGKLAAAEKRIAELEGRT